MPFSGWPVWPSADFCEVRGCDNPPSPTTSTLRKAGRYEGRHDLARRAARSVRRDRYLSRGTMRWPDVPERSGSPGGYFPASQPAADVPVRRSDRPPDIGHPAVGERLTATLVIRHGGRIHPAERRGGLVRPAAAYPGEGRPGL